MRVVPVILEAHHEPLDVVPRTESHGGLRRPISPGRPIDLAETVIETCESAPYGERTEDESK